MNAARAKALWLVVRTLWQAIWRRAPRQLRITRSGRVLLVIAFAAGLAAINTGNNLLFLGWGTVLSAIILSGLLSEATLRIIHLRTGAPEDPRAGEPCPIPIVVENRARRLPAFGVEVTAHVERPVGELPVGGPYALRLNPGARLKESAPFVPSQRGLHELLRLTAQTSYPFGFFEKSRAFRPPTALRFWVAPQRVPVEALRAELYARLGETPARRRGLGEEFFSLRPFRQGDDVRMIAWRRSARTGRLMVRELEAQSRREVILELHGAVGATDGGEYSVALLASLAELLLADGRRVGVWGPGLALPPASGPRQRRLILRGAAQIQVEAPWPNSPEGRGARVALVASGHAPAGVDCVLAVSTVAGATPRLERDVA